MTSAALPILLCLFSAITVAAANFAVKRGGDVLTARMVLSLSMAASVLPFAPFVPVPPMHMWGPMAVAVGVHWIYQFCMIRSLHRGDLSLVFPVMRGLGPLAAAIMAVAVLGETLKPLQMAGLATATLALIVFAIPTGQSHAARSLDRRALFWAVMTACGIGAYSVVDAQVARDMPNVWSFIVWLFLLDWIGIVVVTLYTRRGKVWARVRPQLKAGMIGGVAGTLSYGAAILAYTLTDVAIVAALRETSVVFAALLGAVFLREGFGARRGLAALVLAGGLVMMQVAA
jgi:drug/metabolite transporter (DMT)-like permease